jgi:ABC-type transport system involved in cytochrome c biogenesis permease component
MLYNNKKEFLTMTKKLSNIILYLGCLILIASLIYLIINLNDADKIISIWLPITASGAILVFLSQIVKSKKDK